MRLLATANPRSHFGVVVLSAAVALAYSSSGGVAHAKESTSAESDAEPLQRKARTTTAKKKSVKYSRGKYVIQATIALSNVQRSAEQRSKISLDAKVTFENSGASRTASRSTKLSDITVVSTDAAKGIAVVQVSITGDPADNIDAVGIWLQLVGAAPTPHP